MATDSILKDALEELGQFVVIGGKYLIITAGTGIAVFAVVTLSSGVIDFIAGLF